MGDVRLLDLIDVERAEGVGDPVVLPERLLHIVRVGEQHPALVVDRAGQRDADIQKNVVVGGAADDVVEFQVVAEHVLVCHVRFAHGGDARFHLVPETGVILLGNKIDRLEIKRFAHGEDVQYLVLVDHQPEGAAVVGLRIFLPKENAAAVADLYNAHRLEHLQRLAQGVAADAELLGQLALRRELIAHGEALFGYIGQKAADVFIFFESKRRARIIHGRSLLRLIAAHYISTEPKRKYRGRWTCKLALPLDSEYTPIRKRIKTKLRVKRKNVKLYKMVEPILTRSPKKGAPDFPDRKPGALLAFTKTAKEGIII